MSDPKYTPIGSGRAETLKDPDHTPASPDLPSGPTIIAQLPVEHFHLDVS